MQPTLRSVLLVTAGVPVALLPAVFDERLWPAALAFLFLSLVVIGVDAFLLLPPRDATCAVATPAELFIGADASASVELVVGGAGPTVSMEVLCDLDETLEHQPAQLLEVEPGEPATAEFLLRPRRRGTARLERVWLRWTGPFGLVSQTVAHACDRALRVVPDVQSVRATALRFFGSPRAYAGLKTERFLGDGSEFESLRRYVPGMDPRAIDWKASARHTALLCRHYRAERNHQVVFALDSGQLMAEPLDGVPRIDHAINGALLLSYFCLRTGDRAGLYAFDSEPRLLVEPAGGVHAFPRLRHRSAEIEYGHVETNFTLGILELLGRLGRRSLVVVFTEFVDTVTAELMLENLERLAARHLVLFVSLRDPTLEELERREPRRSIDLHRAVVAADLSRERRLVFRRLRQSGVQVIDTLPSGVSAELLNRYLDIKRRELV